MTAEWSYEAFQDAQTRHEFIHLLEEGVARVHITDAHDIWLLQPEVIFQTGYRVAGLPETIRQVLAEQGISSVDIEQVVHDAITSGNYGTTMAPVYNQEMEDYQKWLRAATKANSQAGGAKMWDIILAVNPQAALSVRTAAQAKAMGLEAPMRKTARGKSFDDRIASLAAGKVLDVSKLQPNGTGARAIDAGKTGRKYGVPTLPIVSADLEHYLMAVRLLSGGEAKYSDEIAQMEQIFSQRRAAFGGPPAAPRPIPVPVAVPQSTIAEPMLLVPQEPFQAEKVYPLFSGTQKQKMFEAQRRGQNIPQPVPTPTIPQPVSVPTIPQPVRSPSTIPQPVPTPTIPQPVPTPTIPQPIRSPATIPQPVPTPTIPQPVLPQPVRSPVRSPATPSPLLGDLFASP